MPLVFFMSPTDPRFLSYLDAVLQSTSSGESAEANWSVQAPYAIVLCLSPPGRCWGLTVGFIGSLGLTFCAYSWDILSGSLLGVASVGISSFHRFSPVCCSDGLVSNNLVFRYNV